MKLILFFVLTLFAFAAAAEPVPKLGGASTLPQQQLCPKGQAISYTLVCDPGTLGALDVMWHKRTPGTTICRARMVGCTEIRGRVSDERAGYEVRDAAYGDEMVVVTFGLEQMLGEGPWVPPIPFVQEKRP